MTKIIRRRRVSLAVAFLTVTLVGVGLLSSPADSAGGWDNRAAAKPAVMAAPPHPTGPVRGGWNNASGPGPIPEKSHLIYQDDIRNVWLMPSAAGDLCMVIDVFTVTHEQALTCSGAEDFAKAEPFIFASTYSTSIGVLVPDGKANEVAAARRGVVAAPNLVWIERTSSDTPMAFIDPIERRKTLG
ncbi:MAG: hypothetical protein ACKV2O_00565 [Acidimicrobiales bacterium]